MTFEAHSNKMRDTAKDIREEMAMLTGTEPIIDAPKVTKSPTTKQVSYGQIVIGQRGNVHKFKALMLITFSPPEVAPVLVSNESPYFSHYKPQISASISPHFGSYSRKSTHFWYTNFAFLMYFHNSFITSVTCLFLPQERN